MKTTFVINYQLLNSVREQLILIVHCTRYIFFMHQLIIQILNQQIKNLYLLLYFPENVRFFVLLHHLSRDSML